MPIPLSQLAERLGAEVDGLPFDTDDHRGIQHRGAQVLDAWCSRRKRPRSRPRSPPVPPRFWSGRRWLPLAPVSQFCVLRSRVWRLPAPPCCCVDRSPLRPSTLPPCLRLGCKLPQCVSIGAHASVEEGASIGAATIIGSGAVIGAGVRIGSNCHIYPRVVIYPGATLGDRVVVHAGAVLGADGFGYVRDRTNGEYTQFPQQGTLVIEDDVEIGANTTIDRGALEETRIGRGTKLDNLIHIGHNCSIGRNVVIAAQTGISGSSAVGDGAILGGQVGMGDHAMVGPGVILGGQAGILPKKKLLGPGIVFWGTPAKPVRQYLKELAMLARLKKGRVMAIVVVGGHSRSVGKTSVVASLIARLPERNWTACKITQFGHGFCSANGEPCDCQTDEHTIAISAERDPNTGTDSARFLAAGARRSLWVRTRIGRLADAMPRIRQEIDAAENIIFESNSLLQFLRPDLYLTVLDHATADFKDSARLFLDRADAVLLRASGQELTPQWNQVSLRLLAGKPRFLVTPPDLIGDDLVAFVEQKLT